MAEKERKFEPPQPRLQEYEDDLSISRVTPETIALRRKVATQEAKQRGEDPHDDPQQQIIGLEEHIRKSKELESDLMHQLAVAKIKKKSQLTATETTQIEDLKVHLANTRKEIKGSEKMLKSLVKK